jgi:hypothetical protein
MLLVEAEAFFYKPVYLLFFWGNFYMKTKLNALGKTDQRKMTQKTSLELGVDEATVSDWGKL